VHDRTTGLRLDGITLSFGQRPVLRGLDLAVRPGAIFALVGENGSGKSTTLEIAAGLRVPDHGTARLDGRPIRLEDPAQRRRIGVSLERPPLQPHLDVRELLRLHARLYAVTDALELVRATIERLGLLDHARLPVPALSKGMRQRVCLALATLHTPDLILLDEPTSGLDELGRALVAVELRSHAERGAAVLLTTHDPQAAEAFGATIHELERGTLHTERPTRRTLVLETQPPLADPGSTFGDIAGVTRARTRDARIVLDVDPAVRDTLPVRVAVHAAVVAAGAALVGLWEADS
jgi:ABC-type multidrug transport system ATPase subunit